MTKPVGGRGLTAPYVTTHVRIPVDIKPQVEVLVSNYRNEILGTGYHNLLTASDDNSLPTLEQATELALRIVNSKQSARKSMSLLLTAIYGKDIKL